MSAVAGYKYKILVCDTKNGTFLEIPGSTGSFNKTSDILDVTTTMNVGYHSRIQNLLDTAISTDANWSATDPALVLIETQRESRGELWAKVLPDSSSAGVGEKVQVLVESMNLGLDINAQNKLPISFQCTGAVFAGDAV